MKRAIPLFILFPIIPEAFIFPAHFSNAIRVKFFDRPQTVIQTHMKISSLSDEQMAGSYGNAFMM
jgi:hypothetical protein